MSMSAPDLELARSAAQLLRANAEELAEAITSEHYRREPSLEARYGAIGREKCRKDAAYHLSYLNEALLTGQQALFDDYVAWAKVMLAGRGIGEDDLSRNLDVLRTVVTRNLDDQQARVVGAVVDAAIEKLRSQPSTPPSALETSGSFSELSRRYLEALLAGRRRDASEMILDAVQTGASVRDIYLKVFQPVQHEVGRLWQMNKISVAHEHYCTAATQLIMSQLYREIFSRKRTDRTFVAACVGGELHEIGMRMVADFFEMEGWNTFFLGSNTPNDSLIRMVCEEKADVIGISATITYHVDAVADLIRRIRENDSCREVKVIVGGYPFNIAPDLWREVGADGCASSAADSVDLARQLVGDAA